MALKDFLRSVGIDMIKPIEVQVNGDEVTVYLRQLSADEAEDLLEGLRDEAGNVLPGKDRELRNRIVAASLCDENGNAEVSEDEVGKMPHSLFTAVAIPALSINGFMAPSEAEQKKE